MYFSRWTRNPTQQLLKVNHKNKLQSQKYQKYGKLRIMLQQTFHSNKSFPSKKHLIFLILITVVSSTQFNWETLSLVWDSPIKINLFWEFYTTTKMMESKVWISLNFWNSQHQDWAIQVQEPRSKESLNTSISIKQ